jgi:2-hydroxychromene-2-carboxylate isomerase
LAEAIDFYFDFTSPYSYLASEGIDDLAGRYGRPVQWRPILLGAVFQAVGTVSLVKQPDKADYSVRDFMRSARFLGIPYSHPANFPALTVAAARAFYWLDDRDGALARRFGHAVFRAYFAEGRDIGDAKLVAELAGAVGADPTAVAAGLQEQSIKDRLRAETDGAIGRGVFGAPWIVVDQEPFWGADRLPQVERWLASGGF